MSTTKIALVTGASSGFGQLTAARLAASGYRVFGTSRKPQTSSAPGVEMLVLDVCSDESVQACVAELLRRAGRLDLLVNNAGQAHASLAEETDPAQARDVLETNFWGAVRVINAVLPTLRKQRSGHIINVSSLAGLLGTPGQAFYSASKFALEGYSEALSIELHPFHIQVSLDRAGLLQHRPARVPGAFSPADSRLRQPALSHRDIGAAVDNPGRRPAGCRRGHRAGCRQQVAQAAHPRRFRCSLGAPAQGYRAERDVQRPDAQAFRSVMEINDESHHPQRRARRR